MTPHQPRVAVLGGGILAASVVAHLARAGARATLVARGALADGASGRSLAWLNSSGARSSAYHYLRLLGIDRYRTWQALRSEEHAHVHFDGALKWAAPGESLHSTFAAERAWGYDSKWIERDEVSSIAPAVNADAVSTEGAIYNPGEGWVDLPGLITELVSEASQHGAQVLQHTGEARVSLRDGAVDGVLLPHGDRIPADAVILATGASVLAHLAELGVPLPETTPLAFVVITEPLEHRLTTVLNTPRVAVRPLPGSRLVFDADWSARTVVQDGDSLVVPEDSVHGLVEEASRVLAGNPRLRVADVRAGLKPIPGDGEPVAGAIAAVPGLHVMFTHSGATLGLILGELMAEQVLTASVSPVLEQFQPGRFDTGFVPRAVAPGSWTPVTRTSRA